MQDNPVLKKWLNLNMVLVYGIIGITVYMFEALGKIGTFFGFVGLVCGLIGLALLGKAFIKQESKLSSWILFLLFILMYIISVNVAID